MKSPVKPLLWGGGITAFGGLMLTAIFWGEAIENAETEAGEFRPAKEISYGIDHRTGFCFYDGKPAQFSAIGQSQGRIPCTDEVLDLVNQDDLTKLKAKGLAPR